MEMITFHTGAQTSFTAAATELLGAVKSYPKAKQPTGKKFDIHPKITLQEKDIIGTPLLQEHLINGTGEEIGRFWDSCDGRFGWAGEEFRKLQRLAERF